METHLGNISGRYEDYAKEKIVTYAAEQTK